MPAHRTPTTTLRPPTDDDGEGGGVSRRRFLGYLIAAPTLVVAAEMGRQTLFDGAGSPTASAAGIPGPPQTPEFYDLSDALRDSMRPTANLIKVEVNRDGTVSFDLPRSDNGQGIMTAAQIIIAEEMDLDPDQVVVTLADARPELVTNQLTGGSATIFCMYTPIRVAAAIAKGALLDAAAAQLGQEKAVLTSRAGNILGQNGESLPFGELTEAAAVPVTRSAEVVLKEPKDFTVIGKPRIKSDARAIVTGAKQFATDLKIPDALPTVVCRGPGLNSFPLGVENIDEVRGMPGVTDVVQMSTGVAVRAATFGQCIDGVNALTVDWDPGTVEGEDDDSILAGVRAGELPLAVPSGVGETLEGQFVFYPRSGSSLEPNGAIADVRDGTAEIWSPCKNPIAAQSEVAKVLGLPVNAVTFHVPEGGGSFGRKLTFDAALEAAEVSQKLGKPVKLMWTRADDCRQGRVHPMATTRVRALVTEDAVASFEIRHTSIAVENNPGLGEPVSLAANRAPLGNLGVSEAIFELTQLTPYQFGASTRFLNEVDMRFNTQATRNVYSPDICAVRELMVDRICDKLGRDPYEFRSEFTKLDRWKKVLDRCAEEADWGRSMEPGTAQGIAMHIEYKAVAVCVVELDCRPETVNRQIRQARTGPRVTKVTYVVDPGLLINPLGYQAQMMGGINDGLANVLTAGLHLDDGHFVEASWDNYFYTRQWNTPTEMNVVVIEDSEAPEPGGAGEFGVAASGAAAACAYARATGTVPEYFPILHKEPLPFEPYPTIPPIPPSPTDGLETTY